MKTFDEEICPDCKAHTRNGICLNACQLARFRQLRRALNGGDATPKVEDYQLGPLS